MATTNAGFLPSFVHSGFGEFDRVSAVFEHLLNEVNRHQVIANEEVVV